MIVAAPILAIEAEIVQVVNDWACLDLPDMIRMQSFRGAIFLELL
jgi:hypothetical protein